MATINFTYLHATGSLQDTSRKLVLAKGEWIPHPSSGEDVNPLNTRANHGRDANPDIIKSVRFNILESHQEDNMDEASAPPIPIDNTATNNTSENTVEYDENGRPLLIYVSSFDQWAVSVLGSSVRDMFRQKSTRAPQHENLISGSF